MDEIRYKVQVKPMTNELYGGLIKDLGLLGLSNDEIYRSLFEYTIEKIKEEGLPEWLIAVLSEQ